MEQKVWNLEAKKAKLKVLAAHFKEKEQLFAGKEKRARSWEKRDDYWEKKKMYLASMERINRLLWAYHNRNTDAGLRKSIDAEFVRSEYEAFLKRKEAGKEKYLTSHKFLPWFLSGSMNADYGSFSCDKCGATFYHSPSTILLAGKEIYHCCCGHCTNRIIKGEGGEEPYF